MARPYRPKRWRPERPDPAACYLLAQSLSISPVTAQVLYNRGLTTPELAAEFVRAGRGQILDPFLLKGMESAVRLIQERISEGRPIMVYGDYDADGVTGTATLVSALRALGATVDYYIPNRFSEGYGLNATALQQISERGFDFVVSVDTGISAVQEAQVAQELGITLVITDHHEPGPILPAVPALINPKQPDCPYPFKGLSGVGVAFKLALALGAPNAWELIDIVTLGTIADMVPLVGENRSIVKEGLSQFGGSRRPGLRALMEVAGVKQPVTAGHIGYFIGPRINALGRMGSAMLGVELLLTEDEARGRELARLLDEENAARQEVEAAILEEALKQAEAQPPEEREYVLVLAGEGWHHGVVGICASRVLEAYHRPTILLAIDGEEVRGSARSIPTFHLHKALSQVSDLFSKFGGHAAAAGMSLRRKEDVGELRRRLNALAAEWLRPEDLIPEQRIDAYVRLDQVDDRLMAELQALEPHGIGNPAPILAATGLQVADGRTMGKEQQHLKLMLRAADGPLPTQVEAVGWNMAPIRPESGARVQIAFQPEINTFMGRSRLQLTLRDLQQPTPGAGSSYRLTNAECLAWDPLAQPPAGSALAGPRSMGSSATVFDGRDERLAGLLAEMGQVLPEVAATQEGASEVEPQGESELAPGGQVAGLAPNPDEEEHHEGEPPSYEELRLAYLTALLQPTGQRLLLYTSSPWTAEAMAVTLERDLADRRGEIRLWLPGHPEPTDGQLVVTAYGQHPEGTYTDTLLCHPPYQEQRFPGERLHLLWQGCDWAFAESALGWPYPDRPVLVELYKLLRAGDATSERLAAKLGESEGPWNQLRFQSGLAIFAELGLVSPDGRLRSTGNSRFELESSPRYSRGQMARQWLAGREWRLD